MTCICPETELAEGMHMPGCPVGFVAKTGETRVNGQAMLGQAACATGKPTTVGSNPTDPIKKNGIGSHTKPNKGKDVIWLTPPDVLAQLGTFDLDPCAAPSPRPWPTAVKHIELPENGLSAPWHGRVWLNPPYDETLDYWMERMASHGIGIALTFARTETDIWQRWIWPYAKLICFFYGRLYFRFPDGSRAPGNAGGPSALIAYSENDADHLWQSGISGAYVKVLKSRSDFSGAERQP